MTRYNTVMKTINDRTKIIRNLGTFNKFFNGANITKIKPTILLIKNLG